MPLAVRVITLAFSCAAAAAQVGPCLTSPMAPSAFFDLTNPATPFAAWNNGASTFFYSISAAIPQPTPPGSVTTNQWFVGLCFRNPIGGAGLADLKTGIYTQAVPGTGAVASFVENVGQVAAFNTVDGDRALQFDSTGTIAVFERIKRVVGPSGTPSTLFDRVYVSRLDPATNLFVAPLPVLGVRGLGGGRLDGADPAIGTVGGRLKLFYFGALTTTTGGTPVQGLIMDDLVVPALPAWPPPGVVAYAYSGFAPQILATPAPGHELHSPTPITGNDGDVQGLWFAEGNLATNDSDMWLADDLDPATPAVKVFDNAAWKYNGTILGGQFLSGDDSTGSLKLDEAWGAWLLGDEERVGNPPPLDFTVGGPPLSTALVFLSAGLGTPFPVAGACGLVGLANPFQMTMVIGPLDAKGLGGGTIPTPAIQTLAGSTFHAQAAVIDPNTNNIVLTNTARLRLL